METDSPVDSAMKGIQTAIENLTRKLISIFKHFKSY